MKWMLGVYTLESTNLKKNLTKIVRFGKQSINAHVADPF